MKEEQSKQDVRALFHFFSRNIREQLLALPLEADGMEEVRLRVSAPLYYIYKNKEYTAGSGFRVSREDVDETLQCAARSSLYAYGEEIRQGFLTVQGGHRIGVAGRTILGKRTYKGDSSDNLFKCPFFASDDRMCSKNTVDFDGFRDGKYPEYASDCAAEMRKNNTSAGSDPDGVGWRRGKG